MLKEIENELEDLKSLQNNPLNFSSSKRSRDTANKVLFNKLKTSLALREKKSNFSICGNYRELFFLLSHNIIIASSINDKINIYVKNNQIVFEAPIHHDLLEARAELTKFVSLHIDNPTITSEQLSDPLFLKSCNFDTMDIKLLIKALDLGYNIKAILDSKREIVNSLNKMFDIERQSLLQKFAIEMHMPPFEFSVNKEARWLDLNDYNDLSKEDYNTLFKVFDDHPIWSKKMSELDLRQNDLCDKLLSNEDLELLNIIGSYPSYISLFVMREIIEIDNIVIFDLDEKLGFLSDINKLLS